MVFDFLNALALDTGLSDGATEAATDTGTSTTGSLFGDSPWTMVIWIVLLLAVFYFLMYRPQKKKDKEKKNMLESMKKGDRVTTIGGLSGKIVSIKDQTIVLDVATVGGAEKVKIEIQRWAVGSVDKASDEVVTEETTEE